MNPSRPFILRPIATSLLMLALLLAGFLAYRLLPVSALPEVDYPTIRVSTFYPGASPDVMASLITSPLERQFGQMTGLTQMTSSSSMGVSIITLKFSLSSTLDVAEQYVQAAINAANNFLPNDLPNPPIYNKVNPADAPIMTLALTSKTLPLPKVEDFADTRFSQKIAQLPGVGLVSIIGGQRPAVRIKCNPLALSAYGLTLETVRNVVSSSSINLPKGNFEGFSQAYAINANDQLMSSDAFKSLIIGYKNNAPIRLQDVAEISDQEEDTKLAAWMNNTPAVILNIQRQPGANVIEVVDRIQNLLPQLKASLPGNIDVHILADRTLSIRASVNEAQFDLLIAVALVVLVIFVFLGSFKATIIPSIAVPLSLIGTFSLMYLMGFSLNNLTIMALTIASGFVVDDAIVMIENIARYIESGEKPLNAALKGSKQIAFTIISLTVSLIAVLIPLLFMQDIIGRLFREFAISLSITILLSAFVSLTLTPMLCAYFLKIQDEKKRNRFENFSRHTIEKVTQAYGKSLNQVLQHQNLIILIAVFTLGLTGVLFYFIPKGFFPIQDTGIIQGISEAPQSISFKAMTERQKSLANVILQDPTVENISSFVGVDGTNTTLNSGRFLITLKSIDDRDEYITDIMHRLQEKLETISGIKLYMQSLQDLSIDDRVSRTQYQYSLNGPNEKEVTEWTEKLVEKLKNEPKLRDIATDQQNLGLKLIVTINRDIASRLGITPQQIDNVLYDAFGQRQILTLYTQVNQYHVILEVEPTFQTIDKAIHSIYLNASSSNIPSTNNQTAPSTGNTQTTLFPASTNNTSSQSTTPVALASLTKVNQELGPLVIHRQGQFPVSTISFNLSKGAALGDAIDIISKAKKEIGIPDSVQTSFEGAAKIFQSSLDNEIWLILAAIIVVYIILGILYESYIHPVTILSTLPSATVGALCALLITQNDLSVIALIGVILVIGIVMKNAIMMIDFALELERIEHKPPKEAIFEACLLRFRPILMTTMAALFGAIPLAISTGMGAELRKPLGIAIIGGLALSQILTLYTTPVIYLAFDRLSRYVRHGFKSAKQKKAGAEVK